MKSITASDETPLLSICIPAYNRPEWLRRTLESIVRQSPEVASRVEVIVSDDSTMPECRVVADVALSAHVGRSTYVHNAPNLGMAENWNRAIQLSTGKFIHLLHDDDFLAAGALKEVVPLLEDPTRARPVNLFGVNVVSSNGTLIRRQLFRRFRFLEPNRALHKILSNPTFVRFPGMIIRRDVFEKLGSFRPSIGTPADTEMWARVSSEYGLACQTATLANFTVHQDALTMGMFNSRVLETLGLIFEEVKETQKIDAQALEKCHSAFLHKFILGGTCRYLRWRDLPSAQKTMQLFDHEALDGLPVSPKWLPLRMALSIFFFWLPSKYSAPSATAGG